ncbi:MAG: M16 family metallopeptidase [Oscillospiraceae bacterium]
MHNQITLQNGVRIVYEQVPYVRSAAVGIWVGVGSRYERKDESGSAHFIEHMLFKGTEKRTANQLADIMDSIGGHINAYTTRETTCFYARVLDSHLDTAIDLLGDMFFNSLFAENDVSSERGVIFEEIDMYDDSPEDLVSERLVAKCFPGALGRPILGTKRTLSAMTGQTISAFMHRHYVPSRVVVSLCGSFSQRQLDHITSLFSRMAAKKAPSFRACSYRQSFSLKRKATEQNHLCLGFPCIAVDDERRFALHTLSSILGSGMSSRLFQTVREKYGLCYAVYSFSVSHKGTGLFGVTTALNRDSEKRALALIISEINRLCEDGVSADELSRAVEQAKSSIILAMESTSSRMNRLGSGVTLLGECPTPDEVISRYDAVTSEDVLTLAREIFDFSKMSFSAVGRVDSEENYRKSLEI